MANYSELNDKVEGCADVCKNVRNILYARPTETYESDICAKYGRITSSTN